MIRVSDHTYQLTNFYFLDPAWFCDVILAVLQIQNTDDIHQGGNMVRREHLEKLCVESGFGIQWFEEYLQLLSRFEIVLSAGDNW